LSNFCNLYFSANITIYFQQRTFSAQDRMRIAEVYVTDSNFQANLEAVMFALSVQDNPRIDFFGIDLESAYDF